MPQTIPMPGPHIVNTLLGVWLFLSAFLWQHNALQFNNAWVAGGLGVLFGITSLRGHGWGSYGSAGLGAWLLLSSFVLPVGASGTFWNHLVVGMAMLVLSVATLLPHDGRGNVGDHVIERPEHGKISARVFLDINIVEVRLRRIDRNEFVAHSISPRSTE